MFTFRSTHLMLIEKTMSRRQPPFRKKIFPFHNKPDAKVTLIFYEKFFDFGNCG